MRDALDKYERALDMIIIYTVYACDDFAKNYIGCSGHRIIEDDLFIKEAKELLDDILELMRTELQ